MPVRFLFRYFPLAAVLVALRLHAAQFLVVTRPAGGEWSIEAVEGLLINGKDKVRSSAIAGNRPPAWDAKAAGRLPETALSSLLVVRRAPDGNVWGKAAAEGEWITAPAERAES